MDDGIVLQWAAIIFTTLMLIWTNQGKSTKEKKAGLSFLTMTLLLNIGYLFELMAQDRSAAFLAVQIEYAGLIFMGYFICLFFVHFAKRSVPQWVGVYTLIFDLFLFDKKFFYLIALIFPQKAVIHKNANEVVPDCPVH